MRTVRIDCLVFGYRRFKVSEESIRQAVTLLLHNGINAKMSADGSFISRERDSEKIFKIFKGRVVYEASERLGLPGVYKRLPNKIGVFLGIIASVFLFGFFSNLVWDVRVTGNETIPDSAVVYSLSEANFSVGDMWNKSDRSKIETEFLRLCPDVSWININRRGTVAYVTLIEKERHLENGGGEHALYANVTAAEDCVIEDITVVRGTAEVKVGDTVKKGDLLISGILPESAGGGLCYAEGSVIGRIGTTVSESTTRIHEEKLPPERRVKNVKIKIFNFCINILKIYGNSGQGYDIIKDIDGFSLFGVAKLPIEVVTEYSQKSETAVASYTDKELVEITSSRLTTALSVRLLGCDLVKMKTKGEFTEDGYVMKSDIVYLKDVSQTVEFDIN